MDLIRSNPIEDRYKAVFLHEDNVALVRRMVRRRVCHGCAGEYDRDLYKELVPSCMQGDMEEFLEVNIAGFVTECGTEAMVLEKLNQEYAYETARKLTSDIVYQCKFVDKVDDDHILYQDLPVARGCGRVEFECNRNQDVLSTDVPDRPNFFCWPPSGES
tara:strand:+ start:219 stop:698 length:480 start_codon:yes stop_codon:yes gene_type:complete